MLTDQERESMTHANLQTRLTRLGIEFPFMAAPMVGLTHAAFRELVRSYTPSSLKPLLFSEMLSALRLPSDRPDRIDELRISDRDRENLVMQILGGNEQQIEKSISKIRSISPWGVDINMGCTLKVARYRSSGISLMDNPETASNMVKAAKRHLNIPVSVKTRIGVEKADFDYLDFFTEKLEKAGADFIIIHARLKKSKHSGDADWKQIERLRMKRAIPVVANGDIQTAEDAISLIERHNVDGSMIGRAITARPWIFWQIAHKLGIRDSPEPYPGKTPPLTREEEGIFYLESCLRLIDFLEKYVENESKRERKFIFHVRISHIWYLFGHAFFARCLKARKLTAIREMILESQSKNWEFPSYNRIYFY
ncbi:MAG: tRNA-dihydrouridine synthase family protein [Oligoflexales bacterium]|nr:tRNA-dihydrouridine synthase family protein [Oligoflexales bacterium]